jgi:hypothetical protein
MVVKKTDIRQLHVGKSLKERQEYLNSLRPYYNFNKTEEKPSIFDKTDSSSSNDPDKPLDTAHIKGRSPQLIITDFIKGNWGVTIIGGLIVALISASVIGYFTLWSDQKAQDAKVNDMQNSVHDISKKQDSLNDKNADLNTDFQVFKAGIAKDVEFIKYKIGISSK